MTFGIEEELFLVEPQSRDLLAAPSPGILEDCAREGGPHKIVPEVLRSQIETNTKVCASVAEAGTALRETRALVARAAARYGAAILAASTHPFAKWEAQVMTPKERYQRLALTFQESLRRFLVGGMHMHIGFGDADERVQVMTALRRYLPALHGLSTSSPFSDGRNTGFKSYRLNLIGALPRTSLPGPLHSRAQYDSLVADYRRFNFIDDASELWWDIRPSHNYPTIELRICDVCTRAEDALAIAALYAALTRRLLRDLRAGALPPEAPTEIIAENRWLAQRYGTLAFIGDAQLGERVEIADYIARLIEHVAEDARALNCEKETQHALHIINNGSSADRQLDHYRTQRAAGANDAEALRAVVDHCLAETLEGI